MTRNKAQLIEGKAIAKEIRVRIASDVEALKLAKGIKPKLSVILAGEDRASQIYVRNKEKFCAEVGMESEVKRISSTTSQDELVSLILAANQDNSIHGLLVQLPLPKQLDPIAALNHINPNKDVDGLHPINLGKLLRGEQPLFVPCTPKGIMHLILSTGQAISGKEAIVVGRSNIVGKPIALLLLQQHATVTICHSRTKNLAEVVKRADILIVAVGSPKIIKGKMVKTNALVVDVGANHIGDRIVGDVDFDEVSKKAAFITPVPGGVGPMTIAMLLQNTLLAAQRASD